MSLYLMILALQVTVLVLIAGGLHFLFRRRPGLQHFVWLVAILSIGVAIPLQTHVPSLEMQIPVATEVPAVATSIESSSDVNELPPLNVVRAAPVQPKDVATAPIAVSPPNQAVSSQSPAATAISALTAWHGLSLGYISVCLVLALRLLFGFFALNRLRTSVKKENHSVNDTDPVIAAAKLTCSRRRVQVLLSDEVQVPMAFGLWRPTVLLPTSFTNWSEEAQRAVLLHEFAHVQRFDAFWDLITRMVAIVWWIHPAVHFATRRLRQTRERATDQLVLQHGVSAAVYAKQLLEIATRTTRLRQPAVYMSCQGDVTYRIKAILENASPSKKKSWNLKFALIAGFLVLASASIRVSFATTPTQEEEKVVETKKEPTKPEDVTGKTFYQRVQQIEPKEYESNGRTLSISGRVTDEDGNPVPDAIVVFRDASTSCSMGSRRINDVIAKTVSGADGRYSFDTLDNPVRFRFGPFTQLLCVSKKKMGINHFRCESNSLGSFENVDIKVADTVSVKGTVVDPEGNPIANTRVSLSHLSEPGEGHDIQSHFADRLINPESMTDKQGRFELPGMPGGFGVGLDLNHPEYAPTFEMMRSSADHPLHVIHYENRKVEIAENGATIPLKKGVELSGVVTDGDGNPLAGVDVSTEWRKCSTDSNGRFSYRGRKGDADEKVQLLIHKSPRFQRFVNVKQSELEGGGAKLKLVPPGKITGKVVSAQTGRPIEGVGVSFEPKKEGMGCMPSTDSDGVFETQIVPGEIDVILHSGDTRLAIEQATAEGCKYYSRPVSYGDAFLGALEIKSGETRELTIKIPIRSSARVKVLKADGSPAVGALVGYQTMAGGTAGFVKTDSDGLAGVDPPPLQPRMPRRLIARFEDRGKVLFAELNVPREVGQEVLEMKLTPSITVSGIVSVQSRPIKNATVTIRRPNGSNPAYSVATGSTDERGFYSIQVPRGAVKGRLPGYRAEVTSKEIPNRNIRFAVNKVKLVEGQLKASIDLFQGAGQISGIVVDAKGNPVANCIVEVNHLGMRKPERKEMRTSQLFEQTSKYTDSEGRFEFTGLPEGFEAIIVAGASSTRQGASIVSVGNQDAKVLVPDVGEESKVNFPLR